MGLPDANSTTVCDLYCLWAACPCLSWSAVAMRALTWVVFVPRASFTPTQHSGSSPSSTQQWEWHIPCTKGLHEIFKYAHLKFTVYGHKHTYIHTTSANAATLVWGSLRLAPKINRLRCYVKSTTAQNVFWLIPGLSAIMGWLGDGDCYLIHRKPVGQVVSNT